MARFAVGDIVRVTMPRGPNKRGIVGISVLYTTSPEARFDGAVGTVAEVNPRGPLEIPLYLVSFRGHDNRTAIPWMSQWFREEWLRPAETKGGKNGESDKGNKPAEQPAGQVGEAAKTGGAR